jgi:hypothetical protein
VRICAAHFVLLLVCKLPLNRVSVPLAAFV